MKGNFDRRVLVLLILILIGAGLDKAPLIEPEPVWKDIAVAVGIGAIITYSLWRLGDFLPAAITFGVLYFLCSQKLDDINPLPKAPEVEHQDILFVILFLLLYVCFSIAHRIYEVKLKSESR